MKYFTLNQRDGLFELSRDSACGISVKIDRKLFNDYAFSRLSDREKIHVISLFILDDEISSKIPFDSNYVAKQICVSEFVNLDKFLQLGFIALLPELEDTLPDPTNADNHLKHMNFDGAAEDERIPFDDSSLDSPVLFSHIALQMLCDEFNKDSDRDYGMQKGKQMRLISAELRKVKATNEDIDKMITALRKERGMRAAYQEISALTDGDVEMFMPYPCQPHKWIATKKFDRQYDSKEEVVAKLQPWQRQMLEGKLLIKEIRK